MNVLDSIVTQAASIVAIRKDIHAHPELCFQEQRTADVVPMPRCTGIPHSVSLAATTSAVRCS